MPGHRSPTRDEPARSRRAARPVDGLTTAERERPYTDDPGLLARGGAIRGRSPRSAARSSLPAPPAPSARSWAGLPPLQPGSSLDLARSWYRRELEQAGRPTNTVESYCYDLVVLEKLIGPKPIDAIDQTDIARLLGDANGRATRKRRLTSARRFFRYLIDDARVLRSDPTEGHYPHTIPLRSPVPLFPAEQEALLAAAADDEPWSLPAIWLMLRLGLTRAELLALRREHIDLDDPAGPVVYIFYDDVTKRGKERKLAAGDAFRRDLHGVSRGARPGRSPLSGRSAGGQRHGRPRPRRRRHPERGHPPDAAPQLRRRPRERRRDGGRSPGDPRPRRRRPQPSQRPALPQARRSAALGLRRSARARREPAVASLPHSAAPGTAPCSTQVVRQRGCAIGRAGHRPGDRPGRIGVVAKRDRQLDGVARASRLGPATRTTAPIVSSTNPPERTSSRSRAAASSTASRTSLVRDPGDGRPRGVGDRAAIQQMHDGLVDRDRRPGGALLGMRHPRAVQRGLNQPLRIAPKPQGDRRAAHDGAVGRRAALAARREGRRPDVDEATFPPPTPPGRSGLCCRCPWDCSASSRSARPRTAPGRDPARSASRPGSASAGYRR